MKSAQNSHKYFKKILQFGKLRKVQFNNQLMMIKMMIIFFTAYLLLLNQILGFNNGFSFITNKYYSYKMNGKILNYSKKAFKQNLLTVRCNEFDHRKHHRLNPAQSKKYHKFNILDYFQYSIRASNKMHEKNQIHDQQSANNSNIIDLSDIPSEELGKFNLFDTMCDDSEHRKQCEILSDEFSPIHDFDIFME